ncbi:MULTISPECIES: AEC family transporter [Vagococcus]|uniref:AEC family transporter n=1 Tax=Vagococcus TaxID=2737 RepID=UPI0011C3C552|nr:MULTISPECIES: AEC family transporter [Vagococcus]
MTVFNETIVLIFFMFVGVLLNKRGKYSPGANIYIGHLLTTVALPAAIINSFQVDKSDRLLIMMKQTAIYTFIMIVATLLITYLIATLFKKKDMLRSLWVVSLTFSNILFIGIPIVGKLYGEVGLIVLVVCNTVTSLFLFTVGIMFLSNSREIRIRSILTTPAILAAVVGFVLFMFGVKLPKPIHTFNVDLSIMTASLSMIINGSLFSQVKLKELFFDKDNLQFLFVRAIIIPIIFIPVLKFFITDPTILGVLVLLASMPVGSLDAILAEEYAGAGTKVSQYIALTTVTSMVTLPIIMSLI